MAETIASASLVGFYSLNGNLNDTSGNGNNGTLFNSGSSAYTSSGYDSASAFSSSANAYFTIPINVSASVLPQVTFGGWFYATSSTNPAALISTDLGPFARAIDIDTRGGTLSYSAFTGSGVLGSTALTLNQWVFVAARYNTTTGTVTLNVGNQQYSTTATATNSSTNTWVGRSPGFGESYTGRVSDAFVYNTALTDSDLNTIRLGGAAAIVPAANPTPEPATFLFAGSAGLLFVLFRLRKNRVGVASDH